MFKAMSGLQGPQHPLPLPVPPELLIMITVACLGLFPWMRWATGSQNGTRVFRFIPQLETAGLLAVLALSLVALAGSTFNPFIYQRF